MLINEIETKETSLNLIQKYFDQQEKMYDLKIGNINSVYLCNNFLYILDCDKKRGNKTWIADLTNYKIVDIYDGTISQDKILENNYNSYKLICEKRKTDKFYKTNCERSDKKIDSTLWDAMSTINNNMATIIKDGKYGVIDKTGKILIKPMDNLNSIDLFPGYFILLKDNKDNLALFKKNKYLFNFNNQIKYDKLYLINERSNYFCVKNNDKYGFIDNTGKIIIDCKYDKIEFTYYQDINKNGCWYNYNSFPIYAYKDSIVDIYDKDLNLILSTNKDFNIIDKYIIYKSGQKVMIYNMVEKKEIWLNDLRLTTEDNKKTSIKDEEKIIKKYPYYEIYNGEIILHKTKKYGIEINSEITNKRNVRWFKTVEELENIENYIFEELLNKAKSKKKTISKVN